MGLFGRKVKSVLEVDGLPKVNIQDLVLPVVKVEGEGLSPSSSLIPVPSSPSPSLVSVKASGVDLGKALEGLASGDSGSAVAGIREVGKPNVDGSNLPMISVIKNPMAFTACQVHAGFAEELGYSTRAKVYRWALNWSYQHSVAVPRGKQGNRVDAMLAAYKIEFQKEFEIKKHSKVEGALGS